MEEAFLSGLFGNGERAFQSLGTVRSDPDVELTGLDLLLQVAAIEGQSRNRQLEGDRLAVACLDEEALESFQLLDGAVDRSHQVAHIELGNLGTAEAAGQLTVDKQELGARCVIFVLTDGVSKKAEKVML